MSLIDKLHGAVRKTAGAVLLSGALMYNGCAVVDSYSRLSQAESMYRMANAIERGQRNSAVAQVQHKPIILYNQFYTLDEKNRSTQSFRGDDTVKFRSLLYSLQGNILEFSLWKDGTERIFFKDRTLKEDITGEVDCIHFQFKASELAQGSYEGRWLINGTVIGQKNIEILN